MATIIAAHFQDFHKEGNGGVFSFQNINFYIKCCSFYGNTVDTNGGSIYGVQCQCMINKTTFAHSFSTAHINQIGGNAMYLDQCTISLSDSSTEFCGEVPESSSDSSIRFSDSTQEVRYYNASHNSGYWGGSSISFILPHSGSSLRYMNAYDNNDYHGIEIDQKQLDVCRFCNFVKFHPEYNQGVIWSSPGTLVEMVSCCFFEVGNVKLEANSNDIPLINCLSDQIFPSIETTTQFTTIQINIDIFCPCSSQVSCNCAFRIQKHLIFRIHMFSFFILSN